MAAVARDAEEAGEVTATDWSSLRKAMRDGARRVRVGWEIRSGELDMLAIDLSLNTTLESLGFSMILSTDGVDGLERSLQMNITLTTVMLADGDPHEHAILSVVDPDDAEVAALVPLVRGLRLVVGLQSDDFNHRAMFRALSRVLREDPGIYPDVVLTTLVCVYLEPDFDSRNHTYTSFLLESAHVPDEVKAALSLYLDGVSPVPVLEDLLRAVMDAGADPQGVRVMACRVGAVGVLQAMLATLGQWDVNESFGDWCYTYLCIAAESGRKDVAELLLRAGADVDKASETGSTALLVASEVGHKDVVEVLLQAGADKDKAKEKGCTPLFIASQNDHKDIVELLLRAGADKDKAEENGCTPLLIACQNGHKDVVELLLRAGADKDKAEEYGCTPLLIACQNGHKDVVELLLRARADKNKTRKEGATPLYVASQEGHNDIVELLLRAGADKNRAQNENGATPLYIASHNGHTEVVELLLRAGANKDKAVKDGCTPLFAAAHKGHRDIAKLLLRAGADKDKAQVETGATPLYIASQIGHKDMVELLLRYGADEDKAAANGCTPLYVASYSGHRDVVLLLLEAGADLFKAKHLGRVPIASAAERGHMEVCELLCSAALAGSPPDKRGFRAVDLSDCRIADASAQALSKALKADWSVTLDLSDNLIENRGAQALAEALAVNPNLTVVSLAGNWIGDDGVQALAAALAMTGHIYRALHLDNNFFEEEGAQSLSRALASTVCVIEGVPGLDEEALAFNISLAATRKAHVKPRIRSLSSLLVDPNDYDLASVFSNLLKRTTRALASIFPLN